MGPSLIQRQCTVTPYGFPVAIHALPSFQTRYFYPRCPVAKFLKHVPREVAKLCFQPVPERSHKDQWCRNVSDAVLSARFEKFNLGGALL